MSLALLAAEAALFIRLIYTLEFMRRPMFTWFVLFSIMSAILYQPGVEHRNSYLWLAAVSDSLKALMVIEAVWWGTQKRVFAPTLGFAIFFGTLMATIASTLPVQHGSQLGWVTVRTVGIAAVWIFAAAFIATNKIVRDRKSTRLNSSHSLLSRMPSSA